MPHEPPRASHEGICRCGWCFERQNHRECHVYGPTFICSDCARKIRLAGNLRCNRCKDAFSLNQMRLNWKTGEWFCKTCWSLAHPDENLENEFFKRPPPDNRDEDRK